MSHFLENPRVNSTKCLSLIKTYYFRVNFFFGQHILYHYSAVSTVLANVFWESRISGHKKWQFDMIFLWIQLKDTYFDKKPLISDLKIEINGEGSRGCTWFPSPKSSEDGNAGLVASLSTTKSSWSSNYCSIAKYF